MKTEKKKSGRTGIAAICLFLAFSLGACSGYSEYDYDNWDENSDQQLDANEFAGFNNYDDWDDDDDGVVTHEEFYDSNYGIWDEDDDGVVDEDEWNNSLNNVSVRYNGELKRDWKQWDTNNNNRLDRDEFVDGLTAARYDEAWDRNRDQRVDQREFNEGLFVAWDKNNDGILQKAEYIDGYRSYFGS